MEDNKSTTKKIKFCPNSEICRFLSFCINSAAIRIHQSENFIILLYAECNFFPLFNKVLNSSFLIDSQLIWYMAESDQNFELYNAKNQSSHVRPTVLGTPGLQLHYLEK